MAHIVVRILAMLEAMSIIISKSVMSIGVISRMVR